MNSKMIFISGTLVLVFRSKFCNKKSAGFTSISNKKQITLVVTNFHQFLSIFFPVQAHESAIKCLAIDPHEEHFVTGSADGDIKVTATSGAICFSIFFFLKTNSFHSKLVKVWGLTVHTALYSFNGEHARSSFFKHIGQGVTQLQVDANGRLFSCGADGSMKVRQLPDRESIIHSIY